MDWSSIASIASAVIALAAVVLSIALYAAARRAEDKRARDQRMPVLVSFVADDLTVLVTNVGAGPAMNVFFATWEPQVDGERIPLHCDDPGGTWINPVHVAPLPVGGSQSIPPAYLTAKSRGARSFGIQYTDPFGFAYTTRISDEGTIVCAGSSLPTWPARDVPYPQELPAGSRWPSAAP